MDNQHTNNTDLAYLAGIIDGEGCVTIERTGNRRKSTGQRGFLPSIVIVNTNPELISRCQDILNQYQVGNYIKMFRHQNWKNKELYRLCVIGLLRVYKLIQLIEPYSIAKRGQIQVAKKFIESRTVTHPKGKKYDEYELASIVEIKDLNKKGVRDCTQASEQSDKRQSELHGNMQINKTA